MYTQIPNELFNYLPTLSGAATKILLIVARRTYGWHKSTAHISMQTFEELTGLSRSTVVRSIAELVKAGLLHVQRLKVGDVNEVNCYEILLPVENSTLPVENSKEGSSKMKLPLPARLQPETLTEHSVQELSTGRGGSSKMKLGVVSKSNLYKEKNLKKEYKERDDALALIVETHSLDANPDTTCPMCGIRATSFEVQRYGSCSHCFVKSR